jgi:hypothetical protein
VINDEEQKARELFHDIVVAKSREIYESLMQEEAEEELDESAEEEEEELDESAEEEVEESAMGGDAADDLIDEVEMEEESDINMEGDDEGEGGDFGDEGSEGGDEPATKDDIMDLESKLDQLMAEFEQQMGDEGMEGDGDDFGADEGGDAIEVDDTEEMDLEEPGMMEAVSLKAAPKPTTSEEGGVNKKSTVAANSGATGMAGKPVHAGGEMGGRHDAPGAYSNSTKELGVKGPQDAAKGAFKTAAPKPVTSQASGVNTRSPLAKG